MIQKLWLLNDLLVCGKTLLTLGTKFKLDFALIVLFYFILFRNPNNKDDLYLRDMEWNKFDLAKENYMEVGTYLVEKNGLFLERFRVWDRLFPLIGSGSMTNHANILIMAVSLILKVLL